MERIGPNTLYTLEVMGGGKILTVHIPGDTRTYLGQVSDCRHAYLDDYVSGWIMFETGWQIGGFCNVEEDSFLWVDWHGRHDCDHCFDDDATCMVQPLAGHITSPGMLSHLMWFISSMPVNDATIAQVWTYFE